MMLLSSSTEIDFVPDSWIESPYRRRWETLPDVEEVEYEVELDDDLEDEE